MSDSEITVLIAGLACALGIFIGTITSNSEKDFINQCKEKGFIMFDNNNLIVQCRTTDINLILNKNYWERKE